MTYELFFKRFISEVDKTLLKVLPPRDQYPTLIHEAMHYSVFTGGKRFRPILTLAACHAAGGRIQSALLPAAALELVHTYSLIHDDLPALDNDDLRRGKPTCHKMFGEDMAILAGDALLTLAFEAMTRVKDSRKAVELLRELSTASGSCGMIGGQVVDIASRDEDLDIPTLDYINVHKTGKLIKASVICGAISAGAGKDALKRIKRYGECIGLAFQSVDDLLDGDGYLKILEAGDVRQEVRELIAKAKKEIKPLGRKAKKLQVLADYLLKRIPKETHVAVD